jgi:3-isopropylmalate/(R)-2-methylmalate dehydratase large subunit
MAKNLNTQPESLFEKIWARHVIVERAPGPSLLYIDRHIIHEGSFHAFAQLKERGLSVKNPKQVFGVADHYVPTNSRDPNEAVTREVTEMILRFDDNMRWSRANYFSISDPRQGIVHVIGPEQGISLPGLTITCSDSHTSTHGAFGAIAFGVGQSESCHILTTQSLWQTKPPCTRIELQGTPGPGVSGKDIILAIIAMLGSSGATGQAIEYCGSALQALTIDDRLTMCNMTIEAGARFGIMAPDDTIFDYLYGRPFAPQQAEWDAAVSTWRKLYSDEHAQYARTLSIDVSALSPMVTWGTSPEQALSISSCVPAISSGDSSAYAAMEYMGVTPGQPLSTLKIDRVFIGSCTNARLSDLQNAAEILRGRKSQVPGIVVPGSMAVKRDAEAQGLHNVFIDAGLEWRDAGCSMCVGINGDLANPGERVASTSNRNFVGRQGPGVRTHLMSPAMAAAAAVTGYLTDVRSLSKE